MATRAYEVYFTCPGCGQVTTAYDYHENSSSEKEAYFEVLNVGKYSNHLWVGSTVNAPVFKCRFCQTQTPYEQMFRPDRCRVSDLERYKQLLHRRLQWADHNGRVSFSDWDPNWDQEPALSRLIALHPDDEELKQLQKQYRQLR